MNEQIITTEPISVKPCIKCGAQDRNKHGQCKPCAKDAVLKYRKANRKKVCESVRTWQKANPQKVIDYTRKYCEDNRDKRLAYALEWQMANPDKVKVNNHNRRAKIKGNGGRLSKNIVKSLMALQNGKCACCGKSLKQGYHLDHIMPIALGGKNTDNNVQLLTPKCNLRKSDKHPDDWARLNEKLT